MRLKTAAEKFGQGGQEAPRRVRTKLEDTRSKVPVKKGTIASDYGKRPERADVA